MSAFLANRGPGIAFWLLALAAQVSGYTNAATALGLVGVAAFFLVTPACHHLRAWHLQRKAEGKKTVGPVQIALLVGIAGTWLFMTIALGAASWMLWRSDASSVSGEVPRTQDEGPLVWFTNLTMEGGPLQGRNVFTLQFNGRNSSQKEVALKDANIISAVNGSKLALDIVAGNEIVPIEQIALIPPGAPIRLVAKFGPPAEQPGKIMGLEPKVFLETWRQFFFNVEDDTRKYRIPYNEGHLAVFFPGMVGPHVSKKSGGK